jgi:D-amino peptidase
VDSGRGILAHTINSFAFARIELNGEPMSEAGLYGAWPVNTVCRSSWAAATMSSSRKTRPLFPHAVFVQTKRATGQNSGVSLSPEQSRRAIRAGVEEALAARAQSQSRFVLAGPQTVTLRAQSPSLADLFCQWPSFERVDGVTLRFTAETVEAAVRMLNCCSAMSSMLR